MARSNAANGGTRRHTRFHGRVEGAARTCAHPNCDARGEFRAPPETRSGPDGPPQWRWFCLDHIREFNAGYNFFKGMSPEEIDEAQRPYSGWNRETRAFSSAAASGTPPPRWPISTIRSTPSARASRSAWPNAPSATTAGP